MMKRALSLAMAFFLVLTSGLSAYCAENLTAGQRMRDIERRYGIPVACDSAGRPRLAEQLTQLEQALGMLGGEFIGKMLRSYHNDYYPDEGLRVLITADPEKEALGIVATFSIVDNLVRLYIRKKAVTPAENIVHEFGHVYHYSLSQEDFDEFYAINGRAEGYEKAAKLPFDPSRYASRFAATKMSEDFAESFRFMIAGGGAKPVTAEKDTLLYRKYAWICESLGKNIGRRSIVATRAAEFMGLAEQ